jgi:hypothetical protein
MISHQNNPGKYMLTKVPLLPRCVNPKTVKLGREVNEPAISPGTLPPLRHRIRRITRTPPLFHASSQPFLRRYYSVKSTKMSAPTHIIRFVANEDHRIHLGQLVDTSRDIGLDSVEGREIKAYLINGSIFNGHVTDVVYTVKQLLSPVSMEDCNFIRCLGLNYMDHAKVNFLTNTPPSPTFFS